MGVARRDAIAVIDLHDEAESKLAADEADDAGGGRGDLRAARCRDVDTEMWSDDVQQRMPTCAREPARDRADHGQALDTTRGELRIVVRVAASRRSTRERLGARGRELRMTHRGSGGGGGYQRPPPPTPERGVRRAPRRARAGAGE